MQTKTDVQLKYFMDVIVRRFCRTTEENELLIEEVQDLEEGMADLLQENADLRFKLQQAGIEVSPCKFVPSEEDLAEIANVPVEFKA